MVKKNTRSETPFQIPMKRRRFLSKELVNLQWVGFGYM